MRKTITLNPPALKACNEWILKVTTLLKQVYLAGVTTASGFRLISCFLIFLFPFLLQAQTAAKFQRFSLDQGLSMNFINAIAQDSKGFIWVGTNDGLNKFDGYNFKVYSNDQLDSTSLSNSLITALYVDKEGTLYIGNENGGLNVYNPQEDNFISYQHDAKDPNSISGEKVTCIIEDHAGILWVGTELGGINIFDRDSKTFTRYMHDPANKQSILSNIVRSLAEDKEGRLWVGTDQGISVLSKDRTSYTHFTHNPQDPNSLSLDAIRKIFVDSDGDVWIGTAFGGLNRFDQKSQVFVHYMQSATQPNQLLGNYVPGICEDQNKDIWVATNMGISVFNKQTKTFTNYQNDKFSANSLIDNGLNTVFCDISGNIWIGSIAGLSMKEALPLKFSHYVHQPGNEVSLSSKEVFSFYEDSKANLWIGTRAGFDRFNRASNTFEHYQSSGKGRAIGTVTAFYEDRFNNLWIGTYEEVVKYNEKQGTYEVFTQSRSNSKAAISDLRDIRSIHEDNKGNLWILSSTRGMFRYNNEKHVFEAPDWKGHYIPAAGLNDFYIDKDGTFWLGTNDGLFCINLQNGLYEHYNYRVDKPESLSSNTVLAINEDSKGSFWIGTRKGLNLFDRKTKTFTSYQTADGLPNNLINSIVEDDNGHLWLGTNKGLSHFDPSQKTFANYSIEDGLQHNEFWHHAGIKLKGGELVFGGINGFNLFHPDRISKNENKPVLAITDFQIFNAPVDIRDENSPLRTFITEAKEIVLSYKHSVFSFDFVALNYISSKANQYAYMLEGFDKDWNYVGTQRRATYTNINPGEYIFRVKGSNNDGAWNEEGISLKVTITPPFWQTWWFRILLTIIIIGSAISFYLVRISAIKAQKAKLEKQVQEQTAHLQLANTELTERQEEILQQQEELQAQAELLQQTNDNLRESQQEISIQRDNLKKANEQVMSSIQYAQTIQSAILPSPQKIQQIFPEHFILYRPKDVVSGDFYWFAHLPKEESGLAADISFLAVVDCTGHGVPGAFMSIIGSTILNEVVNQKQVKDPATILELLDQGVKKAVVETEGMNTAGMDVCLCQFERGEGNQTRVLFSGAKRNLLFMRKGSQKVEKLMADRKSIGSNSAVAFTTQELILEHDSMLYLCSDGYTDQNNPGREKLGSAKLHEIIMASAQLTATAQMQIFEDALDKHQEDSEQRDDITLIGIKL